MTKVQIQLSYFNYQITAKNFATSLASFCVSKENVKDSNSPPIVVTKVLNSMLFCGRSSWNFLFQWEGRSII